MAQPITESLGRLYEQLLVARCQTGDHQAFMDLLGRRDPQLRYYVRKLAGRNDSVDDLMQEIWLDVFRGIGNLKSPSALGPWLYRIARRRVLRDRRRRRLPWQSLDHAELADDPADEEFSAEDTELLRSALDQLSPEHREVLVLRFLSEMSYQEIAQVIDCDTGTVRSRIHYAKRALRSEMERTHHD